MTPATPGLTIPPALRWTTPAPQTVTGWSGKPRDARVPMIDYAQAQEQAAAISGDPDLGPHVGESKRVGHDGELGYVALSCDARGQVLQHYRRFRDLLDSVRRSEAARYLEHPESDLSDLSLMPGFSAQSWFPRAFRRWYGDSPHALRRRAGDGTDPVA